MSEKNTVSGKDVILPYKLSAQVMKIICKSEQIRFVFVFVFFGSEYKSTPDLRSAFLTLGVRLILGRYVFLR